MIIATQSRRANLLAWLKRCAALVGGLYLVIALFLGAQIYLKRSEAAAASVKLDALEQEILKGSAEIRTANAVGGREVPSDLGAVAKMQSALEARAAAEHCDLVEFRASSDVAPYLTRFAKSTSVSGWGQVETQATLTGSPKSVLATISALPEDNVPFEFDSIEIKRDKVNSVGDAVVSAHITLRVLIRMERKA